VEATSCGFRVLKKISNIIQPILEELGFASFCSGVSERAFFIRAFAFYLSFIKLTNCSGPLQ
jgi:hypothetical protein